MLVARSAILIISLWSLTFFGYTLLLLLFVPEPPPTQRSKDIHEAFTIATDYISSLEAIPTHSEIQVWLKHYKGSNQIVQHLLYEPATERRGLPRLLGEIPSDSYLLAYWRSEWMEEYAPWSGHSTMCAIEQSCHSFKELRLPMSISFALGVFFMWVYKRLGLLEKNA